MPSSGGSVIDNRSDRGRRVRSRSSVFSPRARNRSAARPARNRQSANPERHRVPSLVAWVPPRCVRAACRWRCVTRGRGVIRMTWAIPRQTTLSAVSNRAHRVLYERRDCLGKDAAAVHPPRPREQCSAPPRETRCATEPGRRRASARPANLPRLRRNTRRGVPRHDARREVGRWPVRLQVGAMHHGAVVTRRVHG